MNTPAIAGWSHTPFGKREETLSELVTEVVDPALAHAGIEPDQVDQIVVSHYNGGLQPLVFTSGLVAQANPRLRAVPALRVENACASGSAAVHQAVRSVAAGQASCVLVVGVEKMTDAPAEVIGQALLGADLERAGTSSTSGFAALFADIAVAYENRYGELGDALGRIAVKAHENGARNPVAHLQRRLELDFCTTTSDRNPLVAEPLRRTDCSPVSDGAAAVVVMPQAQVPRAEQAVVFRGIGSAHDFLDRSRRDPLEFAGAKTAWRTALAGAELKVGELDLIELHDCFTIAELQLYETLDITPPGKGVSALDDGLVYPEGGLPVNPSGGLKSKGHPIGATGVSQHIHAALQLTGTAGDLQIAGSPRHAGIFNMGGVAVANHASILEAP